VNKLKDYSDKLLLALLLILLACLFTGILLHDDQATDKSLSLDDAEPFELETVNGFTELTLRNSHQLMPGNSISVQEANGTELDVLEIEKVVFRRKSEVVAILKNGEQIEGRLTNQDDLSLRNDWKKQRQPLSLSKDRKIINISFAEIDGIKSDHKVLFKTPKDIDLQDFRLSFYQSKDIELSYFEIPERPQWEKKSLDNNETKYDLFTPPVIYLVDGKLSNIIPEESLVTQESEEKFGMELIRFSNEPYPYKLVSWIGEIPYFEDTQTRKSSVSRSFVRNRLEVGIPYKKNTQRVGGQPSLVPTSLEDNEKELMVEKFVVQQYKDEKSGGMKIIGRALVKDFKLGGKPFEINNQMKEVYAGNIKIEVRMTLDEIDDKVFTFTTSDKGISFDFGDRVYTVMEIDEASKKISVKKKGPNQDQHVEKILSLP
jgi:hypothetical protein